MVKVHKLHAVKLLVVLDAGNGVLHYQQAPEKPGGGVSNAWHLYFRRAIGSYEHMLGIDFEVNGSGLAISIADPGLARGLNTNLATQHGPVPFEAVRVAIVRVHRCYASEACSPERSEVTHEKRSPRESVKQHRPPAYSCTLACSDNGQPTPT